jgi:(p)ppGpp synthase/HD superfamily hydrolase
MEHRPNHRSLWHDAAAFAARTHRHQTRRDGETPYFAHPARVALIVSTRFGCDDPETLAIALLHDTIEDSGTDYEDIAERFGTVVADGVAALSKDAALPETAREAHAEARLRAGGWRASLIKLADVLDNTADLADTETANGGDDRSGRRGRLLARARWAIEIAREHAESDPEHADLLRNAAATVAEVTKPFD